MSPIADGGAAPDAGELGDGGGALDAASPTPDGGVLSPPQRLVLIRTSHGTVPGEWQPSSADPLVLPEMLAPLRPFTADLLLVDGIDATPAGPSGDCRVVAHHCPGTVYSGVLGRSFEDSTARRVAFSGATTVDWHIASLAGTSADGAPLIPPFVFTSDPAPTWVTSPDTENRLIARKAMSYTAANQAIEPPGGPTATVDQLLSRAGINPAGAAPAGWESVFALRREATRVEAESVETPEENIAQWAANDELMVRLVLEALVRDEARVINWNLAHDRRLVPGADGNPNLWWVAHGSNHDPSARRGFSALQSYFASVVASLAQALGSQPDGQGGNLLEHTVIAWVSDEGGNPEAATNVPVVILARGAATLRREEHVRLERGRMVDVLATLGAELGLGPEALGPTGSPGQVLPALTP